jgi:hypothetical protein
VSQLLTDHAAYYLSRKIEDHNERHGIHHIVAPAHSQEFNSIVERTLGTVLGMVRTSLIASGLPGPSYGECFVAMCFVLDRLLHRRGGKLSRLEKWLQRLLPNQRKHLHPWGCLAIVHMTHGTRGHVGGPGPLPKLAPRAVMACLVGYHPDGLGYRVALLHKGFKIHTTPHVRFVDDQFPCIANPPKNIGALGTLLDSQPFQDYVDEPEDEAVAALDARRRIPEALELEERPTRIRAPSNAALQNFVDVDCPPDDVLWVELDKAFGDAVPVIYIAQGGEVTRTRLLGPEGYKVVEALRKEWTSHQKNQTYGPPIQSGDVPKGYRPIPMDILTALKRSGIIKVRAILKGFRMTEGIDYNETFSPVPCISSFRFLFAVAAKYDWNIKQGDVRTAFLTTAGLDTKIYMLVPNYFDNEPFGPDGLKEGFTIREAYKAIPGIPQGPRLWHKKCKAVFSGLKLVQSKAEYCIFFDAVNHIYIVVWVDDLFMFYPKESHGAALIMWKGLQKHLDLDDPESVDDCLGCTVDRDRPNKTIWLHQTAAAEAILLKEDLLEGSCTPASTPMTPGLKLSKADCPTAAAAAVMKDVQRWYRSVLASLIYLVNWTRPDMAYAVSKLCRFMHNPGKPHLAALKHLLRYLVGTKDYGLRYSFGVGGDEFGVNGYFDAAHADCPDTYRSTLAYVFFFDKCAISWHSKLHSFVTTSTNHSEYCCSAKACREAKWLDSLCTELGFADFVSPIPLRSDSQGTIAMSYNPVQRAATKHIALSDHYTREMQEGGVVAISFIGTKDMTADLLTKPLGNADFQRHAVKLMSKAREHA